MKSASNIAKNSLQGSKVRLPGVVHMKADLINNIHNVLAGEGVVESSSKTAEVCSVVRRSMVGDGAHLGVAPEDSCATAAAVAGHFLVVRARASLAHWAAVSRSLAAAAASSA